jgi:hypothetical protein
VWLGVAALVATSFHSAQALSTKEVGTMAEAIAIRIEGQNPGSVVLIIVRETPIFALKQLVFERARGMCEYCCTA